MCETISLYWHKHVFVIIFAVESYLYGASVACEVEVTLISSVSTQSEYIYCMGPCTEHWAVDPYPYSAIVACEVEV
jgi:hypothetical protein